MAGSPVWDCARPATCMGCTSCMAANCSIPATGRITADDPGNVAGLTWYCDLVKQLGGIEQINAFTSGFGASQGANNPLYTGQVAMIFGGEWDPYWASRYAPQLQYGVSALPPPAAHPERARYYGNRRQCVLHSYRQPPPERGAGFPDLDAVPGGADTVRARHEQRPQHADGPAFSRRFVPERRSAASTANSATSPTAPTRPIFPPCPPPACT